VDVFVGKGVFTSKNTVEVNGQTLKFAKACVATGGRANVPNIPGLKTSSFLTNASIWNLTVTMPADHVCTQAGRGSYPCVNGCNRFSRSVWE